MPGADQPVAVRRVKPMPGQRQRLDGVLPAIDVVSNIDRKKVRAGILPNGKRTEIVDGPQFKPSVGVPDQTFAKTIFRHRSGPLSIERDIA